MFLWFYCFYFYDLHTIIVCVLLTIYLHYLSFHFSNICFKLTICCHCNHHHYIHKWPQANIVCFFHFINKTIQIWRYIVSITQLYFINSLFWEKVISTILLFLFILNIHNVIVWDFLTIHLHYL